MRCSPLLPQHRTPVIAAQQHIIDTIHRWSALVRTLPFCFLSSKPASVYTILAGSLFEAAASIWFAQTEDEGWGLAMKADWMTEVRSQSVRVQSTPAVMFLVLTWQRLARCTSLVSGSMGSRKLGVKWLPVPQADCCADTYSGDRQPAGDTNNTYAAVRLPYC